MASDICSSLSESEHTAANSGRAEERFQRWHHVQAALCGEAILRPPYIINGAQRSAG